MAGPGALGLDLPAVVLDHVPHHVEAEPEALVGPRLGAVLLPEALEREGHEAGAHALAGVADAEPRVLERRVDRHVDAAAGRRELDRVREQVRDRLLQAPRVAHDPHRQVGEGAGEQHAVDRRVAAGRLQRLLDDTAQVEALRVQRQPAGGDARGVQQVLDDVLQRARAAVHDLVRSGDLVRVGAPLAEQAQPEQHRSQGSPELVREQRQEVVLQVARLLRARAGRLLQAQDGRDVAREAAAVHEASVVEERVAVDQHVLHGAVGGDQARGVAGDGLLRARRTSSSAAVLGSAKNSERSWPT